MAKKAPIELKPKMPVKILRVPTHFKTGVITTTRVTGRGVWYDVNVGVKGKPQILSYRAGDLAPLKR